MQKTYTYIYEGKNYEVIITHKSSHRKSIRFRLRDGKFLITAPYLASNKYIMELVETKYGPRLIKQQKPLAVGDDFIYLFGNRYNYPSSGEFNFSNGEKIAYKSKEEFDKKIRKLFLKIIIARVRYYEGQMGLKNHNVRVRKMSTRYGSNSKKTGTVCFSLVLFHYSYPIIDAIIVHELAHSIYFDHSKKFYEVVYKYCPNYKVLHTKLRKGEFL